MKSIAIIVAAASTICVESFAFVISTNSKTSTALQMGLFDGVKEAFGADGMGELDGDRETPIDRWMGWNTKPVNSPKEVVGSKSECRKLQRTSVIHATVLPTLVEILPTSNPFS